MECLPFGGLGTGGLDVESLPSDISGTVGKAEAVGSGVCPPVGSGAGADKKEE